MKIESIIVQLLLCFSAYSNTIKIFKVGQQTNDQMGCLHAIRVFAFIT
jgi:hypothetical protein